MGVVVPFEEARDPAESLQPLLDIVTEDMQAVNRIILDKAVSDVELIPKLAHHLIESGGIPPIRWVIDIPGGSIPS